MRMFLAVALGLLSSCSMNMIHVDAIADSVLVISERHDAYVVGDDSLSNLEREIYLRDTKLLNRVIEEARK